MKGSASQQYQKPPLFLGKADRETVRGQSLTTKDGDKMKDAAQRPIPEPLAYSINGAMVATSLGRSRIYEFIAEGRLTKKKLGRRTIITAASLRALIDGAA